MIATGLYTQIQWFDPILNVWRNFNNDIHTSTFVSSDGYNTRLCNNTGTCVGATVTTAGSAGTNGIYPYTNSATNIQATADSGATLFTVIVGGAVDTTTTKVAGGSGYVLPPIVQISAPPVGGVQATATSVLTAGAVSSLVITNQGAGYATAPTINIIPVYGDPGTGASYTCVITTSSGTVTALICTASKVGLTAVSTIAFTNNITGTAAATAIMCFTGTGSAIATGASNSAGSVLQIVSAPVATNAGTTNPAISDKLFKPRMGFCAYNSSATPTTGTIVDGGLHQAAPSTVLSMNSNGTVSAAITANTVAYGGVSDVSLIQQI
jgi:hypothetical protein